MYETWEFKSVLNVSLNSGVLFQISLSDSHSGKLIWYSFSDDVLFGLFAIFGICPAQ